MIAFGLERIGRGDFNFLNNSGADHQLVKFVAGGGLRKNTVGAEVVEKLN
jgi:hypothetical protein